jgi:NarL family two-component system response regulator LiaR
MLAQNNSRIRVLIVDDHDSVRMGLGVFIETCEDMVMVGEASNGRDAIKKCEEVLPDVILMDMLMPVMNGIEATRTIHSHWPGIKIIALTSTMEYEKVEAVLKAGASHYLFKSVTIDELATCIRKTYNEV